MRALSLAILPAAFSVYVSAQPSAAVPEFEIARIQGSPKGRSRLSVRRHSPPHTKYATPLCWI